MGTFKKLLFLIFLFSATLSNAQKKPKTDYLITINTEFGNMYAILFEETSKHKANFIKLAETRFYDSTLFHRVIESFMIQGGDPDSKKAGQGQMLGGGDVGYTIPAEINEKYFHKKGVIAAARNDNPEKASSGCQFYIVQGKLFKDDELTMIEQRSGKKYTEEQKQLYKTLGGSPHLDGNYTVYGEVIKGLEVIDAIAKQPKNSGDRPLKDIRIKVSAKKMKKKKITKLYGYQFDK